MGHQRTTHNSRETLKETLQGEFTEFIAHDQLVQEIRDVAFNLDDTSLMITDHSKDLEQIISMRGTITQKKLLIEINVPMIYRNPFKLSKIVTLPMRYQGNLITFKIEHQDYLVNNVTRTYIPIQKEDLQKCKRIFKQSFVCFPQADTYFESSEKCVSNILFEYDTKLVAETCQYHRIDEMNYVKELERNTYFIMPENSILVVENCLKQETSHTRINTTGVIKLEPNCEIIMNEMKISTRSIKTKELSNVLSPHQYRKISLTNITILNTKMDKFKGQEVKYLSLNEDFEKLINDTDKNIKLVESITITEQIEGDLLKRGGLSLLLILILLILLRVIYKCFC